VGQKEADGKAHSTKMAKDAVSVISNEGNGDPKFVFTSSMVETQGGAVNGHKLVWGDLTVCFEPDPADQTAFKPVPDPNKPGVTFPKNAKLTVTDTKYDYFTGTGYRMVQNSPGLIYDASGALVYESNPIDAENAIRVGRSLTYTDRDAKGRVIRVRTARDDGTKKLHRIVYK